MDSLEVSIGWAGFGMVHEVVGMVHEVEAVGEDGTILGGDYVNDYDWVAAADVVALDVLIFGAGNTACAASGAGVVLIIGASFA